MSDSGFRVHVEMKGLEELRKKVIRLKKDGRLAMAQGIYEAAEGIMTVSKGEWVPVRRGVLRSSGTVKPPEDRGRSGIVCEMGYGGAASKYAIPQHERMDYRHTVGKAKYLEAPAVMMAPTIGQKVAIHINRAIGKLRA